MAASLIAQYVFEGVPHLEDEVAYWFQAQVFAEGKWYVPSPKLAHCFSTPFVVDYEGRRFAKYPPGWPALLALGQQLGLPWWVNAVAACLMVALTFRLASDVDAPSTGALAAVLATVSPFVLLLSGSLMSHTTCLVFTTAFLWCVYRSCRCEHRYVDIWSAVAGLMLGCAFTLRPFSTVALAVPSAIYTLWCSVRERHWHRIVYLGLGFVPLALLVPLSNAIWTGDPFLFPYILVWPFDRVGFGPGHGPFPAGNTLWSGLGNVGASLIQLAFYLHGWPGLSLLFILWLFVLKPRYIWDTFLAATALALATAYVGYWTSGSTFGPRYLYEAASALFVLSARGIRRAGLAMQQHSQRAWRIFRAGVLCLLLVDVAAYLPWQLWQYRGLYGITATSRRILEQADLHNALILVQETRRWKDYAVPFTLNSPTLGGDVIYARTCSVLSDQLLATYADREVYVFDGLELVRLTEQQ